MCHAFQCDEGWNATGWETSGKKIGTLQFHLLLESSCGFYRQRDVDDSAPKFFVLLLHSAALPDMDSGEVQLPVKKMP